jgi:hypothetical protein
MILNPDTLHLNFLEVLNIINNSSSGNGVFVNEAGKPISLDEDFRKRLFD